MLFELEDDSHIWDILKSKIDSIYHTFDTRLYTCAPEFDFIEITTIFKLTKTFLIPISIFIIFYYGIFMAKKLVRNESKTNEDAIIIFNIIQLIGYALMGGLIMRLKLLCTPYLCIVVSYIGNKSENHTIFDTKNQKKLAFPKRYAILVLILALMSYQGLANLKYQYQIQGTYSSYDMESMMNWIEKNTNLNDVFVGPMPIMANIKLSTNRPIVNHPHYEDVGLRNRTKYIYSFMYGFRNAKDLYDLTKYE